MVSEIKSWESWDMTLHLIADAQTESGKVIKSGETVEYIGHLSGGAVKVRLADDSVEIINPLATKELR